MRLLSAWWCAQARIAAKEAEIARLRFAIADFAAKAAARDAAPDEFEGAVAAMATIAAETPMGS